VALTGQELSKGDAGGVLDGDVKELPAPSGAALRAKAQRLWLSRSARLPAGAADMIALAIAGHALADPLDPRELLEARSE
jgi:hypothetical protein